MSLYRCPQYEENNDHSCLWAPKSEGGRHLVFSRRIETHEWTQFSEQVDDRAWVEAAQDWSTKKMAELMREITGDPDIVKSGET